MNDLVAGMIITGAVVLAALGAYYVVEVVTVHLAVRRSVAKPISVPLEAWPSTIQPCQSWLAMAIEEAKKPLHIVQAEQYAMAAWDGWEASPVSEENNDD